MRYRSPLYICVWCLYVRRYVMWVKKRAIISVGTVPTCCNLPVFAVVLKPLPQDQEVSSSNAWADDWALSFLRAM